MAVAVKRTNTGKARVVKLYFDKASIANIDLIALILHRIVVSECGSSHDLRIVASPAKEYTINNSRVDVFGALARSQIGIVKRVIIKKIISIFFIFLLFSLNRLSTDTTKHKIATTNVDTEPQPAPLDICSENKIKIISAHNPQVNICGRVFPLNILFI